MSDDLPGVVLRFRSAEQGKTVSNKRMVKVTLDAEIANEDVWESALKQLQELKIYTVNDFKSELLAVLRSENEELTKKLEAMDRSYKTMAAENFRMKSALAVLEKGLFG